MKLFRKRCRFQNLRSILLLAALTVWFSGAVPAQSSPPKPATASVTGRITLGDQPVKGATVMLLRDNFYPPGDYLQKTVTDDDGRYHLTGIAAGTYRVRAIAPGFVVPIEERGLALGKRMTVDDNENLEGIDLALKRGAVITGRVTDANGQPIIETTVRLE